MSFKVYFAHTSALIMRESDPVVMNLERRTKSSARQWYKSRKPVGLQRSIQTCGSGLVQHTKLLAGIGWWDVVKSVC